MSVSTPSDGRSARPGPPPYFPPVRSAGVSGGERRGQPVRAGVVPAAAASPPPIPVPSTAPRIPVPPGPGPVPPDTPPGAPGPPGAGGPPGPQPPPGEGATVT